MVSEGLLNEEIRVLVLVVKIVLHKRWGFDDVFPGFGDTLESEKGFQRKSFENVCDDFIWEKRWGVVVGIH